MEQLKLTDESVAFLREAKSWATFLAILGFIGSGLMVLAGIFVTVFFSVINALKNIANMPDFPFSLFGLFYIILAVVYFFPAYYLYKFADNLGYAFRIHDEVRLTSAMRFLKKHFKFIGIAAICLIVLYVIMIIVFMAVGFSTGFQHHSPKFI